MTGLVGLVGLSVAVAVLVGGGGGRAGRLRVAPAARGVRGRYRPVVVVPAVAVGVMGLTLLGPAGLLSVVAAGALTVRRRLRREPPCDEAELALCLDLLGGTLAAGATPAAALLAVASAAPAGAVRDALSAAAAALARGDEPATAWTALGTAVPAMSDAARVCARAAVTGAAVADELHRLAAALRARTEVDRRRRLQRASVWLVLPLGLCFLPAFVLVGVVPVVVASVPALLR